MNQIIHNSLRKIFIEFSNHHDINYEILLKDYLNEHTNNTNLILFNYQDHELFKDCFNNLYLPNHENKTLNLIGYIDNENNIVFDKTVQKNFKKSKKSNKDA